ncbi:Domain of unknown function (DUF307) [Seminavis robusta]|uniref:Inner membrane component domain-containing protein n=1 Tax=Seminavis robusta TaxID=568900 RepID=A0A9N8HG38_9STRA|nr:Domain of unknown function (DUF307) [Seminavis robusta]|eukprot:Sro555_g165780.1 Domain of unknown function (DUF307) (175) ;mRNA; r:48382-48906
MMRTESRQLVKEISFHNDRRGACSWILNLLWLVLGGWHMWLTWFLTGIALCATIVGIPCGWQAIKISIFLLFPFGKSITYTHENIEDEAGRCCFRSCNCFLNVVWAVTVGWILALQALLTGVALFVTIIGIPFAIPCFKLTYLCFCPFGVDFTAEEVQTIVVTSSTTNYHSMPV